MIEEDRTVAEVRSLLGFARGFGLDEATVREICEAVGWRARKIPNIIEMG